MQQLGSNHFYRWSNAVEACGRGERVEVVVDFSANRQFTFAPLLVHFLAEQLLMVHEQGEEMHGKSILIRGLEENVAPFRLISKSICVAITAYSWNS
mmetsp:Transcript_5719/g.21654  ORF Transcript_5719/g.21654 Transcript_5719/m.21654 type:complete len:97 (-) Transcript_5719:1384-1674(-)